MYFITNVRERAKMMGKNDANHEIEIPITKTQVPNKFQTTISKNGGTSSRLIWELFIGTCLGLGFVIFQVNVCTSTDNTGGRWCTIGFHESPPSADA